MDKQQIMVLFDLHFIRQKGNVIFLGPPGAGKTHLTASLAQKACQAGLSIYFTKMEDLMLSSKNTTKPAGPTRGEAITNHLSWLAVEVGYTPVSQDECSLFFRFIANRYEKSSTVITSSKAFSDWAKLFYDPIIVTATLDRLLHHSAVINIRETAAG